VTEPKLAELETRFCATHHDLPSDGFGRGIGAPRWVVLDMGSSESPVYGDLE
jgi:hypothetical protein